MARQTPRHFLLQLQSTLGNRGVASVIARRSAVGRPKAADIQRDVGFEYETNADTYLAPAPLTDPQRQNGAIPAGAVALNKGDVIVGNMAGLHAKVDLGGVALGSNLEFETDHFPETAAGRNQLNASLKNLERFCALMTAQHATTPQLRSSHLASAFGGAAPNNLRYIRTPANVTGGPQTTAGVSLAKVAELMERTVGGPNVGPLAVPAAAPITRVELGGLADFTTVGNAPGLVRQGIAAYNLAPHPPLPPGFPSDGLVGLSALLLSYIMRGTVGQMYAKQIAPLMARTDFGSMFTNDLDPAERAFLSAGGGAQFIAMFTHIVNAAGVAGGLAAQLFALEPLAVAGLGLHISGSLTRQAWLTGITQNNDLLTPTTFPSVPARPQLFGLGELGVAHDPAPAGGGLPRPIFELRRMTQHVAPHDFTEVAMGLFDYMVALNAAPAGAHPAYGRAPRAQKQPKLLQEIRYAFAAR